MTTWGKRVPDRKEAVQRPWGRSGPGVSQTGKGPDVLDRSEQGREGRRPVDAGGKYSGLSWPLERLQLCF